MISQISDTGVERPIMIILDANVLKGVSLRGPVAELLRAIRAAGVERVAAPGIVFEELAAQQVLAYEEKYAAALDAMEKLNRATPWAAVPLPERAEPDFIRAHWRERYTDLVEPLQTSHAAYEQALFREANLLAPCKSVNSGKHKTGARDAAIWLTAVEYAREHPAETVYFVTGDTDFFDQGTPLGAPLDKDVDSLGEKFQAITSLDDVIAEFATEIPAPEDEVRSILAKPAASIAMSQSACRADNSGFLATAVLKGQVLRNINARKHWFNAMSFQISTVEDMRAYEIRGDQWVTATARWLISAHVPSYAHSIATVSWSWTTRVLVSLTAPEGKMTPLRTIAPFGPITPEDLDSLPAPPRGAAKRPGQGVNSNSFTGILPQSREGFN
ncbi:PIN domain-containing protein [Streptomyces griseoviridis]|uniref:PIN domain-containing protein n=1 Tax=Streptomyces griseoviridis TaxID=45398 RepID=UPI0033CE7F90